LSSQPVVMLIDLCPSPCYIKYGVADIQPFRGLRYDPQRIGDLSAVITPPYDVISPSEQHRYHEAHPHNIIRLDYGLQRAADSDEDNRYTRAAAAMGQWIDDGILVREQRPALYLVQHRFQYNGDMKGRFSLFARVRLEDLTSGGGIRPHERTMKGPSDDRLLLLRACNANLSPIMGLFRHRAEGIERLFPGATKGEPIAGATDSEGVACKVWAVTDEKAIAAARDLLTDRAIYIADGHHRYSTALAYMHEQRARHANAGGDEGYNFVMMTLTPAEDPDLIMLPTHRMVRGLNTKLLAHVKQEWSAYFDQELIRPLATAEETAHGWSDKLAREKGTTFGVYGLDGDSLCLLRARPQMMLSVQPSALGDLDVFILHQVILRQMLAIDSPETEEECLAYTRDGLDAVAGVDNGEYQLAFLLNPTPISSVLAVADEGVRMPQKSTYFHPKTPTGLVINPLWDD
jgi:uncharacterized protein (DUF1015 family)